MNDRNWGSVDAALAELFVGHDAALDAARESTANAGMPDIAVSDLQGKFLALLVSMSGARRVLEIGTLGGYSTIWLASALPPGGTVTSLELRDDYATVARRNLERAGLAAAVEILVGPATGSLDLLAARPSEPFDFVFLDADKENYPAYLAGALVLSRPGTVIVADNVVRKGDVFDPGRSTPVLEGVRRFLRDLSGDPRLSAVAFQTVGRKGHDGMVVARVVR